MIQGFFTTIQEDLVLLGNRLRGKTEPTDENNKKVAFAALRVFATLGMGVGVLIVASVLPSFASEPVGTLFKIAAGAAIYAFNHDVFVMAKNATEQMALLPAVAAVGNSIWEDVVDLFKGKKEVDDAPRQPVTENTLFRPLWDAAIARMPEAH